MESNQTSPGSGGRSPGRTLLVGCGKLGIQVGERLIADGHEVLAIRRTVGALPSGFPAIAQDLRAIAPRDLPRCESVVITLPPDAQDGAGDRGTYATALTHLAEALPSRPTRVLFVSSTRVLEGKAGPRPLTEADAPAPASARAHALLEGEGFAARLFDACIIRPAGIYGPGRESVIRRVRAHAPVDYSRRTNRIHELDLVDLLHTMLRAENPPALVHAVDRAPVPMGEVVTFIADRLGIERPPRATPENGGGTVLCGDLMLDVVGALRFPSFREGYAQMLSGSD
ncbi:Rossmann-fold NAD(P)-binding domain-containing protein [Microbacterium sp. GXF0217]